MKEQKHKVTGITALLAIAVGVLCPLCAIAPLLITTGFVSILALIAPWFAPVLLVLVGISLIGFFLSYRAHKNPLPLILTFIAGSLMYYGRYINYSNTFAYIGGALLIGAIGYDWWIRKNNKECIECKVSSSHKIKHA
jgi:hypothetical protein